MGRSTTGIIILLEHPLAGRYDFTMPALVLRYAAVQRGGVRGGEQLFPVRLRAPGRPQVPVHHQRRLCQRRA